MTKSNDLQERLRKHAEEQNKKQLESNISEAIDEILMIDINKDTEIERLENELKDEKIKQLQNEINKLKNPNTNLSINEKNKNSNKNDNKTSTKISTILFWILIVVFAGAMYGMISPSDSTPKHVKKATSDLKSGITATMDQPIKCSNTQIDGSWVVGCTNGATKWVFEIMTSSSFLGYDAYALNGKALGIMDKPKMQVYQIRRTQNPNLTSKAFNAF